MVSMSAFQRVSKSAFSHWLLAFSSGQGTKDSKLSFDLTPQPPLLKARGSQITLLAKRGGARGGDFLAKRGGVRGGDFLAKRGGVRGGVQWGSTLRRLFGVRGRDGLAKHIIGAHTGAPLLRTTNYGLGATNYGLGTWDLGLRTWD
jgi:hypothetical protein